MWRYTRENDPTRVIQGGFFEGKSMWEMLSLMFKGKASDFPNEPIRSVLHVNSPVVEVSIYSNRFTLLLIQMIRTDTLSIIAFIPLLGGQRSLPHTSTRRQSTGHAGVAAV